jgi:hypothetical protein
VPFGPVLAPGLVRPRQHVRDPSRGAPATGNRAPTAGPSAGAPTSPRSLAASRRSTARRDHRRERGRGRTARTRSRQPAARPSRGRTATRRAPRPAPRRRQDLSRLPGRGVESDRRGGWLSEARRDASAFVVRRSAAWTPRSSDGVRPAVSGTRLRCSQLISSQSSTERGGGPGEVFLGARRCADAGERLNNDDGAVSHPRRTLHLRSRRPPRM